MSEEPLQQRKLCIVADGAWFAYHDRQSLLRSRAKVHKEMPPKDAPRMTSVGPSLDAVEPTAIFTDTVHIQASVKRRAVQNNGAVLTYAPTY